MEFEITQTIYFEEIHKYRVIVKCPDGRKMFLIVHGVENEPDDELKNILCRIAVEDAKEFYARETAIL